MAKKVIAGGILGGAVLFVWQSVSHLLLPLREVDIKRLDHEEAVLVALRDNIKQPGFYFFPAAETRPGMTSKEKQEAMRNAMEKYRTGPSGLMIFHPQGGEALSPRQLLTQFAADVVALLVGAWLLAQASTLSAFGPRVVFVTLLGLLPFLTVNLPYWNWYGFPARYTWAQLADHIVGFALAGCVIATLARKRAAETPRAPL